MMRHGTKIATAVRTSDKQIAFQEKDYIPLTKRFKILGIPFIRGFVTLVEMMIMGIQTLTFSAEVALVEEEKKPSRWEMPISIATSLGLALLLFVVAPAFCFSKLKPLIENTLLLNMAEGAIRMTIFFGFLLSTLLMEDMRRVFMYHGAEHKTVFAWEAGKALTVENVKPFSTRHPRCGTSFLLVVMLVSILVFSLLGRPDFLHRILYKLLLFPVVAGISYEIIRYTGKHCTLWWVKALIWPGLMLQRITTREPSDDQIEVAIAAMKKVV
jgi:uncharacterized protein YqhQ